MVTHTMDASTSLLRSEMLTERLTLALTHPLEVTGGQVTCTAQDVRARLQEKGMLGNED